MGVSLTNALYVPGITQNSSRFVVFCDLIMVNETHVCQGLYFHHKSEMVLRPYYVHNGDSYTRKMASV